MNHHTYLATGIHIAIFCAAVYCMHNNKRSGGIPLWIHASTWIMFVLGTVNIVCSTIFVCKTWVGGLVTGEGTFEWMKGNDMDASNIVGNASVRPLFFLTDMILVRT